MMNYVRQIRSPGIRVQLTLWYTAIFALLILLFSLIFYTTLQSFLASGLDSALHLRAQQIAGGVSLEPATVLGDTARLIQVMMGLVDNALTYTNVGGMVTLGVEVRGTAARFMVRDTGIGIAAEDAAHIFERFYRADPVRSRIAGGSGLGLSIADWVVRAHGGLIAVESQVGQGSTFTVTLPLAPSTPVHRHTGDLTPVPTSVEIRSHR